MVFDINWSGARAVRFPKPFTSALERVFSASVPGSKNRSVSVSFVSSPKMRALNRGCRGIDRVTDVLSFSQLEGEGIPGSDASFAGDVVICVPYVRASAKEQGLPIEEELVRMFVHGAMHCLGYDHLTEREAKKMLPLQERIITHLMKKYEV